MSIEFRGDNKYRFRVRKDGVNYTQNYFCDKKLSEKDMEDKKYPKEVNDAHKKFEVDVMSGRIGANENMKFKELAQLVMDEEIRPNRSKNTVGVYLNAYNNHLLEEFGNDAIGKIKKLKIVQFKNKKLKTHSPASVKLYLSIMAHTLSRGVEWELIAKNPCENVGVDVERKKNYTELLSAEGIAKLIVFINNEPEIFKTIFTTAIGMGYRIGETIGLTVPVVDFEENSIDISTQLLRYNEDNHTKYETSKPKSPNSVRKSYMPNFVRSTLEAWIQNMKITDLDQHLFVNPATGKVYTHNGIYKRFKNLLRKSGLNTDLSLHDLKHLHGAMLANSGADLMSMATRLGDTVQVVDKTYLHSITKAEKESVKKLENFMINNIQAK